MCNANVGMITYQWVKDFSDPYPDLNTWHTCRNFDKLMEWDLSNGIHIPKDRLTRLEDTVDLAEKP